MRSSQGDVERDITGSSGPGSFAYSSRISNGIVFGLDNTKTTTIVCSTYRVVLDDNPISAKTA